MVVQNDVIESEVATIIVGILKDTKTLICKESSIAMPLLSPPIQYLN
jgi:hypothetical protein